MSVLLRTRGIQNTPRVNRSRATDDEEPADGWHDPTRLGETLGALKLHPLGRLLVDRDRGLGDGVGCVGAVSDLVDPVLGWCLPKKAPLGRRFWRPVHDLDQAVTQRLVWFR
jgi:hypothetical protein